MENQNEQVIPAMGEPSKMDNFVSELNERGLKVTDRHKIVEVGEELYLLQPVNGMYIVGLTEQCISEKGKKENAKFIKTIMDNAVAYPIMNYGAFEPENQFIEITGDCGTIKLRNPTLKEFLDISGNSANEAGAIHLGKFIEELVSQKIIINAEQLNFKNTASFKDLKAVKTEYESLIKNTRLPEFEKLLTETMSFLGIID